MLDEEILMTSGPTAFSSRVLNAMIKPPVAQYDERIFELYDETAKLLAKIFQTKGNVIILPRMGRTSMEAAAMSVLEPGTKFL